MAARRLSRFGLDDMSPAILAESGECGQYPCLEQRRRHMSIQDPSSHLPSSVVTALAQTGAGLERWIRLRILKDRADSFSPEELAGLTRELDNALPDAVTHASALAAFFDANAEAIDGAITAYLRSQEFNYLSERKQSWLKAIGPNYAARGAEKAKAFASSTSTTLSDPFCDGLDAYIEEQFVACIGGDLFACAAGMEAEKMLDQYGCS